jgi:hypothetical protein
MFYRWMALDAVEDYLPEMRQLGVSQVARSPRGFLAAYRLAGGDPRRLARMRVRGRQENWAQRRRAFIARHLPQYRRQPTWRRHLALIAWAYDPTIRGEAPNR